VFDVLVVGPHQWISLSLGDLTLTTTTSSEAS
jgi:hypothetical protein